MGSLIGAGSYLVAQNFLRQRVTSIVLLDHGGAW
jgi:hypothetical protein